MSAIRFFCEDIDYKVTAPIRTKKWIRFIVEQEGFGIAGLNYIFCSDPYLLEVNKQYLNHDYYTDIITFDNSETDGEIEGDIFISIDRVKENAEKESTTEAVELRRVLAHGVLHLCGIDDKSDEDKRIMRAKEDYYLTKFQ